MKYLTLFLSAVLLAGCATTSPTNMQTRIDNIPMYGQPDIERPDYAKKADNDFIQGNINEFGTRENASKAWYAIGEKFMREGNLDYAMRRYNQSWLLNPDNYQPYWGFARVLMQQNRISEALFYLEKSASLIDEPYQEVALLSDLGSAYTFKAKEDPSFYKKANKVFQKSTEMDATYPNSWKRWAYSLYDQGKYSESWRKVIKYEELTSRNFPAQFIEKLSQKLSRP